MLDLLFGRRAGSAPSSVDRIRSAFSNVPVACRPPGPLRARPAPPQNRSDDGADDSPVFCLCVDVDRFVLGVVAFRFQPDPPLSGYREPLQRDFVADCRKVVPGRETGDRTLDRERVTARDVSRWLGADTGDAQGLDRLRRRLDAPVIPSAVRAKGRQVFDRPVSDRLGVDRSGLHPRFCGVGCNLLIVLDFRCRTGRDPH